MRNKVGDEVYIIHSADSSLIGKRGVVKAAGGGFVRVSTEDDPDTVHDMFDKDVVPKEEYTGRVMLLTMRDVRSEYEEKFIALTREMGDTFLRKNRDYGSSFSETVQEFGYVPAVARINDKFKRVKNMVAGQQMNVSESMRDNLMDIASYCLLTVIEIDRGNEQGK